MPQHIPDLGWWCISGEALLGMLRRCANGENPDLVYAEDYANADHERVEGNDLVTTIVADLRARAAQHPNPWRRAALAVADHIECEFGGADA